MRIPQSANPGILVMVINAADMEDVSLSDQYLDGSDGMNAGLIRWSAPAADGTATMGYAITIDNSC